MLPSPATTPPRPGTERVLDALRGGHSHYPCDRAVADAIEGQFPGSGQAIEAEAGFTGRFACWAARQGISRLVHAGNTSYLPGRCLHDAAQSVLPSARVVYATQDPDMLADAAALLGSQPGCQAIVSDLRALATTPAVAAMAAEGPPLAVAVSVLLSFVPDDVAARVVASLAAGLPAGSCLAVSVVLPADGPRGDAAIGAFTPAPYVRRGPEEVTAWLDAAGLDIAGPGVTDVRVAPDKAWARKYWPRRRGRGQVVGAVARVR